MTEPIQIQLKKGVLEMCVLALLARRESYAYEIASTLAASVGMGEGTIYPLMRRMQNDELVDTRLPSARAAPVDGPALAAPEPDGCRVAPDATRNSLLPTRCESG